MTNIVAWLVFAVAALLEVGGDAIVRKGLRGGGLGIVVLGMLTLGMYGLVVNTVKWDFSKLLGVYVAVFALCSILVARFAFGERIAASTWLGITLIVAGGLCIQFGPGPGLSALVGQVGQVGQVGGVQLGKLP